MISLIDKWCRVFDLGTIVRLVLWVFILAYLLRRLRCVVWCSGKTLASGGKGRAWDARSVRARMLGYFSSHTQTPHTHTKVTLISWLDRGSKSQGNEELFNELIRDRLIVVLGAGLLFRWSVIQRECSTQMRYFPSSIGHPPNCSRGGLFKTCFRHNFLGVLIVPLPQKNYE